MHLVEYVSFPTNPQRRSYSPNAISVYQKFFLLLEDVIIEDVKHHQNLCEIHISQPVCPHICPRCSSTTNKIHDYHYSMLII